MEDWYKVAWSLFWTKIGFRLAVSILCSYAVRNSQLCCQFNWKLLYYLIQVTWKCTVEDSITCSCLNECSFNFLLLLITPSPCAHTTQQRFRFSCKCWILRRDDLASTLRKNHWCNFSVLLQKIFRNGSCWRNKAKVNSQRAVWTSVVYFALKQLYE